MPKGQQVWATDKGTSSPRNVYNCIITSLTSRSHGTSYDRLGN